MVSGWSRLQVMKFFPPGPPALPATDCRAPHGKPATPRSERPGEPSARGGSTEASGSSCEGQPVGPGYVEEVRAGRPSHAWLGLVVPCLEIRTHAWANNPASQHHWDLTGSPGCQASDPGRRSETGGDVSCSQAAPVPTGRKVAGGICALETHRHVTLGHWSPRAPQAPARTPGSLWSLGSEPSAPMPTVPASRHLHVGTFSVLEFRLLFNPLSASVLCPEKQPHQAGFLVGAPGRGGWGQGRRMG